MKKNFFKMCIIAGILAMGACDDEDPLGGGGANGDLEGRLAQYYLDGEALAFNLYNIIDRSRKDPSFIANDSTTIEGAKVKRTSPTAIEVDFTTIGVQGSDGKVRKGKILLTETGDYTTTGGSLGASFQNFSVDDKPVTGSLTATNQGNAQFQLSAVGMGINNEFTFGALKTITWTAGASTPNDETDDSYSISGSASGAEILADPNANASTFNGSISVTDPLVYADSCAFGIISGIMDLTLAGDSVTYDAVKVDFVASDGCNNSASVTLKNTAASQQLTTLKTFPAF